MPSARRHLTESRAREHILRRCLTPDDPQARRVGLEAEWLVVEATRPDDHVDHRLVCATIDQLGPLPGGSRTSFEPGGQLELSTPPLATVGAATDALAADLATVRLVLEEQGMALVGTGADQLRPPRRVVNTPRYEGMEAHYDAGGPHGRRMMCSTASLQVNLDLGPAAGVERRVWLAQALGPALAAAFANAARPGWASWRLATWQALDRTWTAPAGWSFTDHALEAPVMFVRRASEHFVPLRTPFPFRRWLCDGHELGHPTEDDLDYHLTTVFPTVRPRGWLEIRFVDALPDPWWRAAAAVVTALLDDDGAAAAVAPVAAGSQHLWVDAARHGVGHPALAEAAEQCLRLALDAEVGAGPDDVAVVEALAEHVGTRPWA